MVRARFKQGMGEQALPFSKIEMEGTTSPLSRVLRGRGSVGVKKSSVARKLGRKTVFGRTSPSSLVWSEGGVVCA